MHQQAIRATEISQRQLISSQRPWIKVDVAIGSPLKHKENGRFSIDIMYNIRNVGNYPASDVLLHSKFMVPEFQYMLMEPTQTFFAFIRETKTRNPSNIGHFLFPGDSFGIRMTYTVSQSEIEKSTTKPHFIMPSAIGTVSYRFDTSADIHQTAFLRQICRTDRPRPEAEAANRALDAIFLGDGDIAQSDLTFRPKFMTSDYAN